jgi:hypothetical protein
MSVKEKLLIVGILMTIAAGFVVNHYCPCIAQFLQRLVA